MACKFKSHRYIFLFQLPYLPELTMHNDDLNVFKRMFVNIDGVLPMREDELEAFKYTFSRKGKSTKLGLLCNVALI